MTGFEAPIALFVYNRPEHTRRTLEALQRNMGSDKSRVFIFSDGLHKEASEEEHSRLSEVRRLIREKPWCGELEIVESDINKGLARSISGGITTVLESFDRVIVLEDDLETSPGFLKYMNDALTAYQDEEQVFQVSGFMVRNRPFMPQTGFLRVSTSWGWGTWRRAWQHYRGDADNLLAEVERKGRKAFDLDGFSFHFEELEQNVKGELNTWAVRWYASIFLNDGLCLYPRKSLVRNHGFDGSGVHCHNDSTSYHRNLILARGVRIDPLPLMEDARFLKAMQSHYKKTMKLWTGTRFRDRLRGKIKRTLGINP